MQKGLSILRSLKIANTNIQINRTLKVEPIYIMEYYTTFKMILTKCLITYKNVSDELFKKLGHKFAYVYFLFFMLDHSNLFYFYLFFFVGG